MASLNGSTDQSHEGNEDASEASEGELRPDTLLFENEPLREDNSADSIWKVDLTKGMQFFTLGKSDPERRGRKATSMSAFGNTSEKRRSSSGDGDGAPSKSWGIENNTATTEPAPGGAFVFGQSDKAACQDSADSSNPPVSPEGEVESDANRGSPNKKSTPEEGFQPPLTGLCLAF